MASEQLRFWLELIASIAGMIVFFTIDLELLRKRRIFISIEISRLEEVILLSNNAEAV